MNMKLRVRYLERKTPTAPCGACGGKGAFVVRYINARVKKLEHRVGIVGGCPACRGEGLGRFVTVINGVEQVPIEPVGCQRCGRDWIWQQVIIDLQGDEKAEARRRLRFLFGARDPEEVNPPGAPGRNNRGVRREGP